MSQKVRGDSLNISAENRHRLKALFPSVFTEIMNDQGELVESVDFEKLKAELGTFTDLFEGRRERYGMEWPGKKDALHLIQTLSAATLKPCADESINFDTTENLFIEGENLEVLKLLHKSCYGQVKMIYIDPPYNTGKDLIYHDNFTEPLDTYSEYAGLADGNGKRFSTNAASEGRFHTNWLNMMYSRLHLARNLLRDDGVIFISIDDNEVSNLRKLCDEIFGEDNFAGSITVLSNPKGRSQDKYLATCHEYLLIYMKAAGEKGYLNIPKTNLEIINDYPLEDIKGRYRELELRNTHREFGRFNRPNLFYPFYLKKSGKISLEKSEDSIKIFPIWEDGFEGCWTWGKDKAYDEIDELVARKVSGAWKIYRKAYAYGPEDGPTKQLKTIWLDKKYHTEKGQRSFNELFGVKEKIFQSPKSLDLLKDAISMCRDEKMIVLDFFAGSATTAHAVLEMNSQDGGNRKFILVQIPEPCAPDSEAFKAGYKTIADIGKERIRRVIKKLNKEGKGRSDEDRGFKVLKLDKSNFQQWHKITSDTKPELIEKQLAMHIDHIDRDASTQDLLYEILLKEGLLLTGEIEIKKMAGKKLFSVAGGKHLICLEDRVTKGLIDAVIAIKPELFICLDSAFGNDDQLKANAVLAFNAINSEKNEKINFKTI